jgi:hypothetical protein
MQAKGAATSIHPFNKFRDILAPRPQAYMRFSNNGAAQDQFMKDRYTCLAARGYYRVADTTNLDDFKRPGKCCVPAGTQIQCSPG